MLARSVGKSTLGAVVVKDFLDRFVELLGFSAKGGETPEIFPLASQIILGGIAAILAWVLIHSGQRKSAEEARRLERAKFLHELDEEYADLMARRCVAKAPLPVGKKQTRINVAEEELWLFEYVLTQGVTWFSEPRTIGGEPAAPREYIYINGARHVEISDGLFIDTLTLHRIVAWSKRVASGLQARIIDRNDVLNMWRHILPLARGNRFTFMASMFGVSQARVQEPLRPHAFKLWYQGAIPGLAYRLHNLTRSSRSFSAALFDKFASVRRSVPNQWSGDIAPHYILVQTVIRQAIKERRLEVLNYAGLNNGPNILSGSSEDSARSALDPILIYHLFGHSFTAAAEAAASTR